MECPDWNRHLRLVADKSVTKSDDKRDLLQKTESLSVQSAVREVPPFSGSQWLRLYRSVSDQLRSVARSRVNTLENRLVVGRFEKSTFFN